MISSPVIRPVPPPVGGRTVFSVFIIPGPAAMRKQALFGDLLFSAACLFFAEQI